ncbi:universal stress protein [Luteibacter yeojuensis]|uniref:Universal stress protein n=1 Tax=Luteibacter yeojuensis TaxID=345309 RepID=A0A7X5TP28_9GAMM|nr:universal stress protein [Luteibacter yeojuensis]NID14615.1 universal stress protein [Luteibacter yeojuensis]
MKILIAIDGSATSLRALRFVLRHQVPAEGAQLTLIHVDAPLNGHIASYLDEASMAAYHARNGSAAMRRARTVLREADVPHGEVFRIGDAADEIASVAGRGRFDMIAMGSHGRGAVGSVLLGSVVRKVLERSKVPVVVVR